MPPNFTRKNIRLGPENYLGDRLYFVTICCEARQPSLARPEVARWVIERLQRSAARHGFWVHAYCVMADHVHLLAEGAGEKSNLLRFVNSYKQETGFQYQRKSGQPLWQFRFFDHILRKRDAFESVAWYIWLNPVRKGYCKQPQEYPYSGSFTEAGKSLLAASPRGNWSPAWRRVVPH